MIDAHLLPIPIPVERQVCISPMYPLLLLLLNCNLDVVTIFSPLLLTDHHAMIIHHRRVTCHMPLDADKVEECNRTRPGVAELSHTPDRLLIIMTEPSEKTINPSKQVTGNSMEVHVGRAEETDHMVAGTGSQNQFTSAQEATNPQSIDRLATAVCSFTLINPWTPPQRMV